MWLPPSTNSGRAGCREHVKMGSVDD